MQGIIQDLRYAARFSAKHPIFTGVTVIILALATGGTTTVFSVVNSVLLKPIDYPHSERIVRLFDTHPRWGDHDSVVPANFVDWRAQARSFEHLAAYMSAGVTWSGRPEPERIQGIRATANLFPLLGVRPVLGRLFLPEDERPGGEAVALVTHGFWTRRLGGAPGALGQTLILNTKPHVIVGVLPRGFSFPGEADIYTPMALMPEELEGRGSHYLDAIAMLEAGTSVVQAQAEMDGIAKRLEQQFPSDGANKNWGVRVTPLLDETVGGVRRTLWIALGVTGCILLIACANIGNLMLARAAGRRKEIAVRAAVGAGRARIIRQLLTESVATAILGVALGTVVARLGTRLLVATAPGNIPRLEEIGMDWRVLAFTAALAIITGLAFGVVPALGMARFDLSARLKESGLLSGRRRRRAGAALVAADIAVALLLTAGAGLLVNSFVRVCLVDPGFDADNLLVAVVDLPPAKYREQETQLAFAERILERMKSLPGVEHAAVAQVAPFNGNWKNTFQIEGTPKLPPNQRPSANYYSVTAEYFSAMHIRLVKGRLFTGADGRSGPHVAMISETMARRFFAGENPLGKRIRIETGPRSMREIVGIVADTKHSQLDTESPAQIYEPFSQNPRGRLAFVLRTAASPGPFAGVIRRVVAEVDPDQPVSKLLSMEDALKRSIARRRFSALLLAIAAVVVLALATAGTFSVVAHAVAERTREIGVRIALGATRGKILRLVLADGMAPAAVGIAMGVAASAAAARLLRSQLFGITTLDLPTYAAAALVLLLAVLIAVHVPARRAMRVDPTTALRQD